MGILLSEATGTPSMGMSIFQIIIWILIFAFMVWIMGGPQRKEQKRLNALLSSLEIGDSVMTSSGFYGMVIDISDDTVIVEFGNNKNCRIPMKKEAITQVEKPGAE